MFFFFLNVLFKRAYHKFLTMAAADRITRFLEPVASVRLKSISSEFENSVRLGKCRTIPCRHLME